MKGLYNFLRMFRKNIYHKTTEFYICVNLVAVTGKVPQIMAKKQNSIKNSTKTRSSEDLNYTVATMKVDLPLFTSEIRNYYLVTLEKPTLRRGFSEIPL